MSQRNNKPYDERTFAKWGDFKSFIDHAKLEWSYRGQGSSEWPISSSLERCSFEGPIERIASVEHQILEEFKRAAQHYLRKKFLPKTLTEWLALIQHHGSPTRLIDFTRSPYVAAYFAFEQPEPNVEFVSIWIVNMVAFYQRSIYYLEAKGVEQQKLRPPFSTEPYVFEDKLLQEIFDRQRLDCVIPLATYAMNQRYLLQQSVFLSPCNPDKPFMEQLEFIDQSLKNAIIKINLPVSFRNEALRDLTRMNITRVSLFPGLDGFAKSLNMQYSTFTTTSEEGEALEYLRKQGL